MRGFDKYRRAWIRQCEGNNNLIIKEDKNDKYIWYFKIHNLKDTDYEGGVYYGKVTFPRDFPFKEPEYEMLNETGRILVDYPFQMMGRDWSPQMLLLDAQLMSLLGIMNDPEYEDDYLYETTKEEKQKIALKSHEFTHEIIDEYFM